MSDNLIERLRNAKGLYAGDNEVIEQAADEIERLRERDTDFQRRLKANEREIERLQTLYDNAVADRVRMYERIEELESALREIIHGKSDGMEHGPIWMRAIARAALTTDAEIDDRFTRLIEEGEGRN